ncbi:MAG: tRNA pseudouridine(55) synthase TruB [Chloroflexota bacterium]|nr:tRNA pseudouridine(55) synthase TruB [Chloroflexota bacterium]
MGRRRDDGPRIDGILVVSKPAGPTSHDIIDTIRRLTGVRRVGHGGTLDPFAMGVLPVFMGRATRMVDYHRGDGKAYRASVVFGASSTTDDIDGEMTPGEVPPPERAAVEAALAGFRGQIEQIPPDHSAVHVGGKRAYELARGGEKPELAARTVTIRELELVGWDTADPERPMAEMNVRCSTGTYVRSLARDLGAQLGCGAYLGALTRTASGPFRIEAAHSLEHVRKELAAGNVESLLLSPDAGLDHLPMVQIPERDKEAIARGQIIRVRGQVSGPVDPATVLEAAEVVRVLDESGRLVAMAHIAKGRLYPDKVFISPEASS